MDRLQADSILKSFGPLTVLTDIYISCELGETVGLIGRNGSGKSTLLKILFGSLRAEQKYVKANEQRIVTLADSIKHIRYLPQESYLPKTVRIEKLLNILDGSLDIDEFMNDQLVSDLIKCKPNQLSGGEKRLVEILLVLYSKAGYLLLDEPFNGLSPILKESIKKTIKTKAKNKGIIVTDHDYRNVLEISDRILLLYDGGLKNIKNVEELESWGYMPEK